MAPSRIAIGLFLSMIAAGPCRADPYRFDPGHTVASFRCGPLGFGWQAGRVGGARGALLFDPDHPSDSMVEVSLDMSTLHMDWRGSDGEVRGAEFLDVGHFPTAEFKSRRVEVSRDGTAEVTGDMTLHGVTREVTLTAVIRRPAGPGGRLGFLAHGRIRRSDFGIDGALPLLGDAIDLRIEAEASPGS